MRHTIWMWILIDTAGEREEVRDLEPKFIIERVDDSSISMKSSGLDRW